MTQTGVATPIVPAPNNGVAISYTSGIVHLQGTAGEKCRVRVLDTKGRLVAAATAVHDRFAFTDKPSGVYAVMVSGNSRPASQIIVVP